VTAATITPWAWSDIDGVNRVCAEMDQTGYSWFNDPAAQEKIRDPIAFGEAIFGVRPIRYQKMIVEPSLKGNQQTLPKTMFAGTLHNDCAQLGMPPHVQVMVCERQAKEGGGTIILDLWAVLEKIKAEDSTLFHQLFTVPRVLSSGHAPRVGTSWSLCRGNLICIHPATAFDAPVGTAFQRYIDAAPTIRFTCKPNDVYVNNNHRCLHGREGFTDHTRRFIRYLYWFNQPLAAPSHFVEEAAKGTAALAARLSGESFWVKQHFGVEAPELSKSHQDELAQAVKQLVKPTDSNVWVGAGDRQLRVQEAMLSAAWRVLNEADIPRDQLEGLLRATVHRLINEMTLT
jgi:hypothetical protein